MRLTVNDARNGRGGSIWAKSVRTFNVAQEGDIDVQIHRVDGGLFAVNNQPLIAITGEGFDGATEVYVNNYPVDSAQIISDSLIEIPAKAFEMAGIVLEPGQHNIAVVSGSFRATWHGALLVGDSLDGQSEADFKLSADSALTTGGETIEIDSTQQVILPGTIAVLKKHRDPDYVIHTGRSEFDEVFGEYTINLRDDVKTLQKFSFSLPAVIDPEL